MSLELQINNSASASARYVGWAPAPCRIRQSRTLRPLKVVLDNNAGTTGKVLFYGTGAKATGAGARSLTLTLPASSDWVPFWMGGAFGSASVADSDAAVRVRSSVRDPISLLNKRLMVRVRKDAETLTPAERDRFITALATLNNAGAGLFQIFRDMHTSAGDLEAHGGPGFLPWHRSYLLDLERELQNIDRSVALPYWRFDKPAPKLFSPEFFGQSNAMGSVMFSASNPLQFWKTDGVTGVQRTPGFATSTGAPSLRSEAATLALGTNFADFRDMQGNPHGWAHTSFNSGWITSIGSAAKDPLFFLLHCNVDRLWAKWQWLGQHFNPAVTDRYDSSSANRAGHVLPDSLWPWNGVTGSPRPPTAPGGGLATSPCVSAPGLKPTVQSQLDFQGIISSGSRLGFDCDDVPYES